MLPGVHLRIYTCVYVHTCELEEGGSERDGAHGEVDRETEGEPEEPSHAPPISPSMRVPLCGKERKCSWP
jgi:hypothetical protein